VHAHYAHYVVRYVSTETFLNEYVDAIRTNTTAAFKRRYREVDVLLIDDIQFMEGKEGLQEEFFHTFNSLHGANKQIVISSDRVPDAIPTLEDRLRGRFRWGLITDIQPPDMETRLAILRNKAERDNTHLPPDVLEFDMAQQQLADLLSDTAPKHRTDEELLAECASYLGFTVEALKGKSRQRPLVSARQIAMYIFRDMTELSYPAIARLFGGRDHTTVIHAVDKTQRLMRERKQVFDQVTDIIAKLKKAMSCVFHVDTCRITRPHTQHMKLHRCNMCTQVVRCPHPHSLWRKALGHVLHNPQHLLQLLVINQPLLVVIARKRNHEVSK
jgi:chromosomal replication initiator protein